MKQQTAGIIFAQRPKLSIFARLVASIHMKLCMAKWLVGPLGPVIFHLNRYTGVGMRPWKLNFLHFGKYLLHSGKPLTDLYKC